MEDVELVRTGEYKKIPYPGKAMMKHVYTCVGLCILDKDTRDAYLAHSGSVIIDSIFVCVRRAHKQIRNRENTEIVLAGTSYMAAPHLVFPYVMLARYATYAILRIYGFDTSKVRTHFQRSSSFDIYVDTEKNECQVIRHQEQFVLERLESLYRKLFEVFQK